MRLRAVLLTASLLAASVAALAAPAAKQVWKPKTPPPAATRTTPAAPESPTAAPRPRRVMVDGVADTGQFLPDTTLLATIGPRRVTAGDFVNAWFSAYAPDRPRPDSAGRAEFLNSMVAKDLLGMEALSIGRPLQFEDRMTMREHEQRVLSNVLFTRAVVDSVHISEAELQEDYAHFKYEVHLRRIQFRDPEDAERVRAQLLAKRIGWADACRRYSTDAETREKDGDMGWVARGRVDGLLSVEAWSLPDGGYSRVFNDDDGFQLVQALERRPSAAPDYNAVRPLIQNQLQNYRLAERTDVLRAQIRREIGMTYDSTTIARVAARFPENITQGRSGGVAEISINQSMPEFSPEDTARVIARYKDGALSVGRFLIEFSNLSPVGRPNVNTYERLRRAADNMIIEPYMAEIARQRGLDKDPMAVRMIAQKREELLVEHLYQDSVQTHIWVAPAERKAFYEKNLSQFFTFPSVRYAILAADTRAQADSLAAVLRAGADVEAMLADSLHGWPHGSVRDERQDEHGPFAKMVFENLRQGQVGIDGPGRDGTWFVLKSLKYDAGRQLSYDESAGYIDESLQNMKSEAALKKMIARIRSHYPVMSRPELVMRIRLVDPTL